jgi:osmotically inducible protein OsmC
MSLAFALQGAGFIATELSTEAAVTLEADGKGFRIGRSALTLRGTIPNLDEPTFKRKAVQCPRFSTPRSHWTRS